MLPAELLGQVYEQFLGKVIRLTPTHHAVVEDKPEVKKAGGVYYTPTYIVEYIVKHTVGALLEGKKPGEKGVGGKGEPLRILDPACGSGSFLLGAYQHLLDWYRDGYLAQMTPADDQAKFDSRPQSGGKGAKTKIYLTSGGEWRLTTAERKRILLDQIYGVDIDPQAVEVTKLSLLLKVLEGENEETLGRQLSFFHERALPDLGQNIKCGNSLIGPDFYEGKQYDLFGEEERYRINAFDWRGEFPAVYRPSPPGPHSRAPKASAGEGEEGGFEAAIGNPPYLFITELNQVDKQYYFEHYKTSEYRFDVYGLFIELIIEHMIKRDGYLSFIVPHTLLSNDSYEHLRRLFLQKTHIVNLTQVAT